MTHLDDATLLDLVDGRLAAAALTAIDDHLDSCPSCRDVVVALARGPATALAPGAQVGRYVLGELVGTGASGRVYAAWQPELDRRVAIKLVDAGGGAHVVREAQAMARLDHPNVIGVHEVGTSEVGVFVAMDLVGGDTLRAWAARSRPWREVARALVDVARGLAAVHAAGVVHRDVKPDNAIVGPDGRVRLGDFGLARAGDVRDDVAPALDVEASGVAATSVAGTPAYMAPEVLRGGRATTASDQFSFGVVAYELLAGRRPFAGKTWRALLEAIERHDVAAPPATPRWLAAIVLRCLALDPAQRFGSLDEVADRLDAGLARRGWMSWVAVAAAAAIAASAATWLAVGGTPATPACAIDDLADTWTPAARARLGSAPAAAAIDRWLAAYATERTAACAATPPAVGAFELAARTRCLDERRDELAVLIARGSGDAVLDALATLPPPAECRAAAAGAGDPLPLDPMRAASARTALAALPELRARVALGDARGALPGVEAAVAAARASEHAPTLAEALLVEADALRGADRLADATGAARDATAAAERGHADLVGAHAWLARVGVAGDRRELDTVDDLATLADAAASRAGAPAQLVATLARMRGLAAFARGNLGDARALLLDSRPRFAALSGEPSIDVAAVDIALGAVARAAGDLDEAETRDRAALAADRGLRGERHPDVARDLHDLAGVLRLRGDLAGALTTYRAALAIDVATSGDGSVAAALTRNSIGLVAIARGDWPEATAELTRARDALVAAGHGDRAFADHNLGLVAQATGDHRAALAAFERAAAVYVTTIGAAAPETIRLALDRARSERALGDRTAARRDAIAAREAATAAGIAWIADDANAVLADTPEPVPAPAGVAARPSRPPATKPATSPPPKPTPPKPKPRRDVGVYGPAVTW